tara:strand:- start:231 stop:404 length:174 start_codon:yes stop_codon:yes gene_type:complete
MLKNKVSMGFKPSSEKDDELIDNVNLYPMNIGIPDGYWVVTSTGENKEYSYKRKRIK